MVNHFKKTLRSYSVWIIVSCILALFLRIIEIVLVAQYHIVPCLIGNELVGWGIDIILYNAFLAILFPVYLLISKLSFRAGNILVGIFLFLLSVLHIAILHYFREVLQPLEGILQAHTLGEVIFTALTSNVSIVPFIILSIVVPIIIILLQRFLRIIKLPFVVIYALTIFSFCCIGLTVLIDNYFSKFENNSLPYSIISNKSYIFYKSSFEIWSQQKGQKREIPINYEERNLLFPEKQFISDEYPLLGISSGADVLSPYFNKSDSLPNMVFIVVEGLGQMYMGNFHGINLLPFLDSLSQKSLYWPNALTASERSYGVVPSLVASTPYGKRNFAGEHEKVYHLSLINLLAKYNYYSTFFYGQPSWFHNKGPFLDRNGINKIVHAYTFPEKYDKIIVGDYFWGFDDLNLIMHATEVMDSLPESPRLDIYYTGSMHPPFIFGNKTYYHQKLDALIESLPKDEKAFINKYRKYLVSLLVTNDALQNLFSYYQSQPYFNNTIFVIVGDHPMHGIPFKNALTKYHIPLIIYSPLLKHPDTFRSVNSYLDIAPTLLQFLRHRYGMTIPQVDAFIGKILDTSHHFQNKQPVVYMNTSRFIKDIMAGDHYLSNNKILYKIHDGFDLTRIENNQIKDSLRAMLTNFKALNNFVCSENRLIPDTLYYNYAYNEMIAESVHTEYKISIEQEFGCRILHDAAIRKEGLYFFDFSVKEVNTPLLNNIPELVIELKHPVTGENILWRSFDLNKDKNEIRSSFVVSELSDGPLLFNAYFWNRNQGLLDINSADSHLYLIRE